MNAAQHEQLPRAVYSAVSAGTGTGTGPLSQWSGGCQLCTACCPRMGGLLKIHLATILLHLQAYWSTVAAVDDKAQFRLGMV